MAISTVNTKLCLSLFAEYLGIHPLSFNGISLAECTDGFQPCEAWFQYPWQNSTFISRNILGNYIYEAEVAIENFLGMFVAPTWTSEIHEWPNYYRIEYGKNNQNQIKFITNWRNIIQFGKEKLLNLGTFNVLFFDRDEDGFHEIAQVTAVLDEIPENLCELYVTYPNKNGNKAWEICPLKIISVDEGTNTIVWEGFSWNFVNESLLTTTFNRQHYINGCDNEEFQIFQSVVEVWQSTRDECFPDVELIWKDEKLCAEFNCEEYILPGCALSVDKCNGIFSVAYQAIDEECESEYPTNLPCTPPDFIRVNYQSGCNDGNCDVCSVLQMAIIKLAASKLPIQLCNCLCFIKEIQRLQVDTAISYANSARFSYPFSVTDNPFGTTIGAIETYMLLMNVFDNLC